MLEYSVAFALTLALVACFHGASNAFHMDRICLAEPPCPCRSSEVDCRNSQLTSVPKFLTSATQTRTLSVLTIHLDYNDIVEIGARAFSNLSYTNAADISINLQNNKINSIDEHAFEGIGDAVTYLKLENNNMSHIPDAFASLTHLKSLYLIGNPLLSMSSPSIYIIGRTLTYLRINMSLFTEWPTEFSIFQHLTTLETYDYPLHYLPLDAMQGFKSTLTRLRLQESALERIPPAVCQLEKLIVLYYIYNRDTEHPLFQACDEPMTTVKTMYLFSNNLDHFPDILNNFPSLTSLQLDGNNIRTIDSSLIPSGYPLQKLFLSSNDLYSIPNAISHFQSLTGLYLMSNGIRSVEERDLEGLTELRHLYFQNNPIEYVANTAFHRQTHLLTLDLRRTNLKTIPIAVTSLAYTTNFYLIGSPIECSCKLSHLKTWYPIQTRIRGTCVNTGEEIENYLHNHLAQCP